MAFHLVYTKISIVYNIRTLANFFRYICSGEDRVQRTWEMFIHDIRDSRGVFVRLSSIIEKGLTAYKKVRGPGTITAGFFALLASVLSIVLIFQHLRAYNNPAVHSSPMPYQ